MKLLTKLTLFITLSKILIVVLFVLLLPTLVSKVSFRYTNYYLDQQKKKVNAIIEKNGIEYYLQGDSAYGSYTMLKEEYISLSPAGDLSVPDTIETSKRIVESDTLNYRVLTHVLEANHKKYVLEIGKTIDTIGQYNTLLQRFTLYVLIGLIAVSILADLIYTHVLLQPLSKIVRTKILNRKFPFRDRLVPVKTSTTDFKYLDDSLISLMEKIQAAFDKEREFTSNASHELMTPISILQTHAENMLVDESLNEGMQQKIMSLMKTLNRLKKIVHSLLFIARIDNEQFTKTNRTNVQHLVHEVMEELQHRLETNSLQYSVSITPNIYITEANRDLLFQLLYNLINNAIRYNKPHGSIHITDEINDQGYCLSITDTGIGIRAEELSSIFNRFRRSGHTDGEGFGLGLSIVKSIAQYHDARVDVISELHKGTTFTISFQHKSTIRV